MPYSLSLLFITGCILAGACGAYTGPPTPPAVPIAPAPVLLIGETVPGSPTDTLWARVWERYLDENSLLALPMEYRSPAQPGNHFAGTQGTHTFAFATDTLHGPALLSLGLGPRRLLDRFRVFPGDSVRVRFDTGQGRVLFFGPSATAFRCQYELALAEEQYLQSLPPAMYTGDRERFLASPEHAQHYREAQRDAQNPLKRSLLLLGPDGSAAAHLEQLLAEEVRDHPGFEVLRAYRRRLSPQLHGLLHADLTGRILARRMRLFHIYMDGSPAFTALATRLDAGDAQVGAAFAAGSPFYMEYLLARETVRAALEGSSPAVRIQAYGDRAVREWMAIRYLATNPADAGEYLERMQDKVTTPWIRGILEELASARNEAFADLPLLDAEGQTLHLSDFRGRTVFIDYWLSGCQACLGYYTGTLRPVKEALAGDPDIVFVSISGDDDAARWHRTLAGGRFTSESSVNLFAGGAKSPLLRRYNIRSFPYQMLLDADGRILHAGNLPSAPDSLRALLLRTAGRESGHDSH